MTPVLALLIVTAFLILVVEFVSWSVERANRKRAKKLDDTLKRYRVGL